MFLTDEEIQINTDPKVVEQNLKKLKRKIAQEHNKKKRDELILTKKIYEQMLEQHKNQASAIELMKEYWVKRGIIE
jgi:intergrase/recombinase